MQKDMIENSPSKKLENQLNNKHSYVISVTLLVDILVALILCFGIIRSGFKNFNYSLFELLIITFFIQIIFKHKISKNLTIKELIPFSIIIIIELPIQKIFGAGYYGWSNALSGVIVFLLIAINIYLILSSNKVQVLWKIINFISIISAIFILIQTIVYYIGGIRLDQINGIGEIVFNAWKFQFFRPCGLFSEPSHFAELALLSLYYYLFISMDKKKAIITGLGLILSTSSLGIIGLVLLWILYILNLKSIRTIKNWKKVLLYFITIIVMLFSIWYVNNTSNLVVNRITSGGTSGVRINRSFELFNILSSEHKVFGVGIQNQEMYLNSNNIVLPSDSYETISSHREFAQTFGYILCTTGIIGMLAFWVPLINTSRKKDYRLKVYLLLFGYVCLTCCIFSRAIFLIYLLMFFKIRDSIKGSA